MKYIQIGKDALSFVLRMILCCSESQVLRLSRQALSLTQTWMRVAERKL